jgi:hypoxanthine-guanine phosphoribosyltransferase
MDDREIATNALVLLGATAEGCAENGLANPILYRSLEIAIEMAEELDEPDLVMLLKSALIVVGEGIEETMAMVKKIKSQFDFMNTDEYNQDTTSNEEDN